MGFMGERVLFQKLPVSLFVPLASPLAEVHAEVLLRIFGETQRHQEPLSWDLCVTLIEEVLGDHASDEAFAQVAWEDDEPEATLAWLEENQELRSKATRMLRELKQYQWLREEPQPNGTLLYSLPENAFRLLRVFDEIANGQEQRLQGVICNIRDVLNAAVREGNASVRVPQANLETHRLLSHLKELQHTIGLHIERILQHKTLKDVLEQTFLTYMMQVSRSSYHELRTTDHVSRFRLDIYEDIRQLRARYQQGTASPSQETLSSQEILQHLDEIQDQFDRLDDLLQAIDLRHSQFFDSAVRSIQLQLTASTRTSGHLHRILQAAMRVQKEPSEDDTEAPAGQPAELGQLIQLYSLELLDERSLMAPRKPAEPFEPEPSIHKPPSPDELAMARQATLAHLQRAYSRERIRQFAAQILGDQDSRRMSELNLKGPEDLPLLMYLRRYGKDGSLGYRVEELEHPTWIEQAEIGFRDFLIRRHV